MRAHEPSPAGPGIVWSDLDPVMRNVLSHVERWARHRMPLLIIGERGTGKTELARHVHMQSGRTGPFVQESAAGIPDSLAASIVRGHERGAFTGAIASCAGLFEAAHGGTLFLDEIGLASPRLQGELLGVLRAPDVLRLGEKRRRPIDTRLILATNADLREMARRDTFRADLLDRIGCFVLTLPPLRERRDALLPLAHHFAAFWASERVEGPKVGFADEVLDAFSKASWDGNLRQMEDVCRYAVLEAEGEALIEMRHLPPWFLATLSTATAVPRHGPPPRYTRAEVERMVARCNGNKSAAARTLRITPRQIHRILAERKMAG